MNTLLTCKEDYEKILAREIGLYGASLRSKGHGWIMAESEGTLYDLCFAHQQLEEPQQIREASVNALGDKLVEIFTTHLGSARVEKPWGYCFLSGADEKLIHRTATIEKRWLERLQKKMSRVAKLAQPAASGEGFFVHVNDFQEAFVSFKASSFGQKRMQMDPKAPSRSYLKLEEALSIFGRTPKENETVIDLGAAPGGWSYSALKRGAVVTAIDNGPMKEPVRSHPNLDHHRANALTHALDMSEPADWLLCDMLERPEVILELVQRWLDKKWCRQFVVNLKIQRADPIPLLKQINDPQHGLARSANFLKIRQLYHDREEITVMGEARL